MPASVLSVQHQALVDELLALAHRLADTRPHRGSKAQVGGRLVMKSGVSEENDLVVGHFIDGHTAHLCAEFLLSLDKVDSPEFTGYKFVPDPA